MPMPMLLSANLFGGVRGVARLRTILAYNVLLVVRFFRMDLNLDVMLYKAFGSLLAGVVGDMPPKAPSCDGDGGVHGGDE